VSREVIYTIILEPCEENPGYTVSVPALPGCITEGETFEEALEMAKDAITLYLKDCLRHGEPIPEDNVKVSRVTVDLD